MPSLFTPVDNDQYTGTGAGPNLKLAKKLVTNAYGGDIDVVKNFPWTLTPSDSPARVETPYIKLQEFYLLETYINQLLRSYGLRPLGAGSTAFDALGVLTDLTFVARIDDSNQLYEGMYDHAHRTGFNYKMPYFDSPQTNINNWTQKSTYDRIVQYQQLLAPYIYAKNFADQTLSYIPDLGPFSQLPGLKELAGLKKDANAYANYPDAIMKIFSGQGGPAEYATATSVAGIKSLPFVGTGIEMYEEIARTVASVERAAELIEIAMKSPMASIDSDPVIDKPHIWTSSSPRVFSIAFPLFNTGLFGNENAIQTITRNWELCYLLTYQNLFNKPNLYTGVPPVFYEIEVPGVHYTKAGYVSNLNILNIGNIRNMSLPVSFEGGNRSVNVPDAYFVNMTLIDFFMPSRNFLDTINNSGERVRVSASASQSPANDSGTPSPNHGGARRGANPPGKTTPRAGGGGRGRAPNDGFARPGGISFAPTTPRN